MRRPIASMATRIIGESVMLRRNSAVVDADSTREQDDEFCRILRIAIERGHESCHIGVRTEPGTLKPIANYRRPDNYH